MYSYVKTEFSISGGAIKGEYIVGLFNDSGCLTIEIDRCYTVEEALRLTNYLNGGSGKPFGKTKMEQNEEDGVYAGCNNCRWVDVETNAEPCKDCYHSYVDHFERKSK